MAAATESAHIESLRHDSATLSTIVEIVRRIMKADTASILGFSLVDEVVTWKAASGFTTNVDYSQPVFRPLGSALTRRAAEANGVAIIQGIGSRTDFPADEFPVHKAEGICDVAIAPLRIIGSQSGALLAGYRTPHVFTDDDKRLLQNLAEMASIVLESASLIDSVTGAERIWAQTFDAIDQGVLVYDGNGVIVRSNAHAAEMLETNVTELTGQPFADAFTKLFGRQATEYYLSENLESPSRFEVETEYGRRYIVSMFTIEHPQEAAATVVTLNDVTRISEMQEQLSRSRRLGSVGQLAAGVAHEINNPLAAIATCAEAITRDLRRTEAMQEIAESHQWPYYLEEILRQSLRCKEITRGLLDLTQQRHAKRVLCDLNALARECVKVAVQQTDSSIVEFQMVLDENLGEVATDLSMVRQIVDNLLKNAVDALGEDGGQVTMVTRRDGDRAMIEVQDNGQGISTELLPRIFDPFVSTKDPGKGYGLGLAICAALAESLGGRLTVASKEGEGSKFRLWIPRRAPDAK